MHANAPSATTTALARAVAINYAKVLAYKDEYEVARLFLHPDFKKQMAETFEGTPGYQFPSGAADARRGSTRISAGPAR